MQNRVSVDFIYWYPILEEVFTDLAWITRSQDSFPMEYLFMSYMEKK